MSKFWSKARRIYRQSAFLRPLTVFFLIFILTGTAILFLEMGENQDYKDLLDGIWWSIVTFSTTGYGDKVPITFWGRVLAVLTIFTGVAGVSYLSGTFASVFVDRNTRARRGLMDYPKIKDHFIICGWSRNMRAILEDILKVSDVFRPEHMILVSNVDPEMIDPLREDPLLSEIKFIRGEYYAEQTLRRAAVDKASKVLVLADFQENNSALEVDSRTIMTVLTIKNISRDVYVCAELVDRKFHSNLKQALCDEIILTKDFSEKLLANTSVISGMSHILYELLAHGKTDSRLSTKPVPEALINRPYKELNEHFASLPGQHILIGLLENTGSAGRVKREALREAQKTADVSKLVSNLQKVKAMDANKPVFIPDQDYNILPYSMAIVVERFQ